MRSGPTIYQDELVKRLKEKSKDAFEELYDRYSGAIFGIIHRIMAEEEVAEEVLQDAFLKYWDRIHHYDATKGRLFTWMANVARNLAIDRTRSKEIKKAGKTDSIATYVTSIGYDNESQQQIDTIGLRDALKSLRKEEQFILEMAYFKGYTQSEITEEYGIPLGTVKTRLRMALKNLRVVLNIK